MTKQKKTLRQRIKEEFLSTTDTLWENEVQANLFAARILLVTATITLIVLILILFNIFTVNTDQTTSILLRSTIELVLVAGVCFYFKGQKKWLKMILLLSYIIVLCRVTVLLGHNVVLVMVLPIILSIRYYSYIITFTTGILTLFGTIFAYYIGTVEKLIRLDLNMVDMPAGTVLTYDTLSPLRDGIDLSSIDYNLLWSHTFQHSLLPKVFLFGIVIYMCTEIARRGRKMIFDQQRETQKSERLATELNLASTIQGSMLPSIFPPFPDRNEFDIYASMDPAKEVGGDFYDFYLIDDDHLALAIADVSGKGIPAAMFMMASKIILNNYSLMGNPDPGTILKQVNSRITSNNPSEMFVTVWFAIVELSTGKVKASNGGHEYPYIYHQKNGSFERFKDKHGLVLGAMPESNYSTYEFQLEPGDAIFVYTDGVPEATNAQLEQFGEERLLQSLNQDQKANAQSLILNMNKDIFDFVQGAPQFDDITMLALRYHGPNNTKEKE